MTERQRKEQEKRKLKYGYVIDLLINGRTIKEATLLTNANTTLRVTERTVQRVKKEFIDNEDRY